MTTGSKEQARKAFRQAQRVFVITGAGISAESGVPTFRNPGGLWNQVDPTKIATPEAFARDPQLVWSWYNERRVGLIDKNPNPGHIALAHLEEAIRTKQGQFFFLTQNVDDLHEQAGSQNLTHIHGEIWKTRCTQCHTVRENREAPLLEIPPCCPRCGGMERPHVVWFGESIREEAVQQTHDFLDEGDVDVVIVIGTEATFPYIIQWANQARGSKGMLIEINLAETALTPYCDIHLQGKSGEVLPELIRDIL